MATTISFENAFGDPISEQQLLHVENYVQIIAVNGTIKRKEEFNNNVLQLLQYYKDAGETTESIVNQYGHIFSIEIRERSVVGSYIVENVEEYRGVSLFSKGKDVKNSKNQVIYSSTIDPITDQIDFDESNKFYYHSTGELYYTFWYGPNGEANSLDSLNPKHFPFINEFKQAFNPEEFSTLVGLDWANMEYYHNLNPMVPADQAEITIKFSATQASSLMVNRTGNHYNKSRNKVGFVVYEKLSKFKRFIQRFKRL